MNTNDAHLIEKRLDERVVFTGRILDVSVRTVLLPNGEKSTREVVLHKGAAAIVAVDEQGRVPLVRQFRAPLERVMLELPAGKKDSAEEDPLTCARRELREETGLTATHWQLLTHMASTPGFSSEVISLYLATGLAQGDTGRDEDEFMDVVWEDLSSLTRRVRAGEIVDSKTALGLLLAEAALGEC
jgi:ADP-ribose pyrophosphatase